MLFWGVGVAIFFFMHLSPTKKKKKKIIISMHGKKPVRSGTETFFVFPSCRAVIVDGEEISEVRYWNVREEREKALQFGFLYIIVFYGVLLNTKWHVQWRQSHVQGPLLSWESPRPQHCFRIAEIFFLTKIIVIFFYWETKIIVI